MLPRASLMGPFLSLPPEILVTILQEVEIKDLIACLSTSKTLHSSIAGSIRLQFRIECSRHDTLDNPSCHLNTKEQLDCLLRSHSAWSSLKPTGSKLLELPFTPSGVYDFSSGMYLAGQAGNRSFRWIDVKAAIDGHTDWNTVSLEGQMIDLAVSRYEHNLAAIVTLSSNNLAVELRDLTNGQPHPEAQEYRIIVQRYNRAPEPRPTVGLEIAGDLLALVVTHCTMFRVYDWRTGECKLQFQSADTAGMYFHPTFIATHIIVTPNCITNALDIWDLCQIGEKSVADYPTSSFMLPTLEPPYTTVFVTSRCDPNPQTRTSPKQTNTPFIPNPSNAIMIINLSLSRLPYTRLWNFSLIVRRSKMLELFQRHQPLHVPFPESKRHDEMFRRLFETSERNNSIPWDVWGPENTRFFFADKFATNWITITSGSRMVRYPIAPSSEPMRYQILDFNPLAIQAIEHRPLASEKHQEFRDVGGAIARVVDHANDLGEGKCCFKETVKTSLPHVEYTSKSKKEYVAMLIDERNLIGLRTEGTGEDALTTSLEVMHFG